MADADSTPTNPLLTDDVRGLIALHATWEIDSIAILIGNTIDKETEIKFLAFRGLAKRLRELNALLMSAVGESDVSNADLQEILGFNPAKAVNHG